MTNLKRRKHTMTYINGRLLAGILATVALGGVVAGCGDSGSNAKDASTPANARPAADAAAVDKAFVRQMIRHHEMAVDMAKTAEKRGEHREIKQLAANVIATQSKEITQLTAIAKRLGVTPAEPMGAGDSMPHGEMSADARTLGLRMDEMGMSMNMTALESADPFDKAFIDEMTPHHEGAIAMAKAQLAGGDDAELKKISTAIISAQQKEIAEMASWRADWYGGATPSADSSMGDMHDEHSGH